MNNNCRKNKKFCLNKLQNDGYRLTNSREAVIQVLSNSQKHLSIEEIFLETKKIHSNAGIASIYRTLDLLVELGFVHKLEFGEGKARYEIINQNNKNINHHHLVCTKCGLIIDYDELLDEEIETSKRTVNKLEKQYEFTIQKHNIQYFGICKNCNK
jgi:Fur family transcriptional regulator, ferric uptake regulator